MLTATQVPLLRMSTGRPDALISSSLLQRRVA